MLRYLRASFLIGALVALAVGGAAEAGFFAPADAALRSLLGMSPGTAPALPPEWVWGLPAVLALLAAWVTVDVPKFTLKGVAVVAALLEIGAAPYVFGLYAKYFSPFAPAAAVTLAFLGGLLYARTEVGGRKRLLRGLVGERVSKQNLRALIDQPDPVPLEGKRTEGTAVCCSFFLGHDAPTELDAKVEAEVAARIARVITETLLEAGGYLESVEARGVRGIFCPELLVADHVEVAARTAISLERKLTNLAAELADEIHYQVPCGISVESGEMLMSVVAAGAAGGLVFSSSASELAGRLAQRNLAHGSRVIAGPDIYSAAEGLFVFRPLEIDSEHGTLLREVYELIAEKSVAGPHVEAAAKEFWRATLFERKGDRPAAALAYSESVKLAGSDEVVRRRLEALADVLPAVPAHTTPLPPKAPAAEAPSAESKASKLTLIEEDVVK